MAAGSRAAGVPTAFQDFSERRDEVGRDLAAAAYQRGDFILSSGESSRVYVDVYLFGTRPTILRRLASLLAELVPADIDRLAGAEPRAVPLVTAVALETGIPFVLVRPDGATGEVAGELNPGERVLVVDDVVATGTQATSTVDALTRRDVRVSGVLAVLDRGEGGDKRVRRTGTDFHALFELHELTT